jgi:hypothetical protein
MDPEAVTRLNEDRDVGGAGTDADDVRPEQSYVEAEEHISPRCLRYSEGTAAEVADVPRLLKVPSCNPFSVGRCWSACQHSPSFVPCSFFAGVLQDSPEQQKCVLLACATSVYIASWGSWWKKVHTFLLAHTVV